MATNTATANRNTEYRLASGRVIWINQDGTADLDYEGEGYAAYCEAEAEGEAYAEFAMSWVHGGGQAEDIKAAYAQWNAMKADWDSGYEF